VIRKLLVVALAAFVVPVAAAAAKPVVPTAVQVRIKAKAPSLAYVPTRLAIGFHYRRWEYRQGTVRIWFRNKAGWEIVFVAARLHGACRAGMEKSFQLDGNKVWWAHTAIEQQAWRCVVGRSSLVRLAAASPQPPTRFADVGLGRVAASGKRIG
jgi:hypothetical protein